MDYEKLAKNVIISYYEKSEEINDKITEDVNTVEDAPMGAEEQAETSNEGELAKAEETKVKGQTETSNEANSGEAEESRVEGQIELPVEENPAEAPTVDEKDKALNEEELEESAGEETQEVKVNDEASKIEEALE